MYCQINDREHPLQWVAQEAVGQEGNDQCAVPSLPGPTTAWAARAGSTCVSAASVQCCVDAGFQFDLPCPDSVAVVESGQALPVSLPPTGLRTADGERQGTAQEPCHSCLRRYAYGAGYDCNALHP